MKLGKVVIAGVGLIGGSFALALKQAGAVREVVGIGRTRAGGTTTSGGIVKPPGSIPTTWTMVAASLVEAFSWWFGKSKRERTGVARFRA